MNVKMCTAFFLSVFVLYEQVWAEFGAGVAGVYQ